MPERGDAYWSEVDRYNRALRITAKSVGRVLFGIGKSERFSSWSGEGGGQRRIEWREVTIRRLGRPPVSGSGLTVSGVNEYGAKSLDIGYSTVSRQLFVKEYCHNLIPPGPGNGVSIMEVEPTNTHYDLLHYELQHGADLVLQIPGRESI